MEPEIPTESNGSKKKFLIIALGILVVVGAVVGYLFMQKDTPGQETEVVSSTVIEKIEAPRVLSKEEKALVEKRMEVSGTVSLTKKEISALGQRDQNTKGISILTEEEKATIEERILVQ